MATIVCICLMFTCMDGVEWKEEFSDDGSTRVMVIYCQLLSLHLLLSGQLTRSNQEIYSYCSDAVLGT